MSENIVVCPCCGQQWSGREIPPEDKVTHHYVKAPVVRGCMSRKPPLVKSIEIADRVLAPLGAWINSHRGATPELIIRFYLRTGRKISRQTLWRWFHADPARRMEPSLGNGLMAIRLIREMRSEYNTLIAPAGSTGPIGEILYPPVKPPKDG